MYKKSGFALAVVAVGALVFFDALVGFDRNHLRKPDVAQAGLIQGIYNATPFTMMDKTTGPIQVDVNGNLKTSGTISPGSTVGVSNWPSDYAKDASSQQIVTELSNPLQVGNFPSIYPSSQSKAWTVGVNNFPSTYPITGTVGVSGTVPVTGSFWQATQPVSGTFWQATQPVSLASVPLPSGAATSANQTTEINAVNAISTALASPSVPTYSYFHIATTTAGTLVKSGATMLHTVTINSPGTISVLTIYDGTSTSGNVVAVVNTVVSIPLTLTFDSNMATGLFVKSTATLPPDITVSYK